MAKPKAVLILGGARSGKSKFALKLLNSVFRKVLIATLEPKDEEMKTRIEAHKRERGSDWALIEEPLNLFSVLKQAEKKYQGIVVDCLTLWLSNLLCAGKKDEEIIQEIEKICSLLPKLKSQVVLVSNEVGSGIVPIEPLARKFQDLQGKANQKLAQVCGEVYLMVAGIPLKIKGED